MGRILVRNVCLGLFFLAPSGLVIAGQDLTPKQVLDLLDAAQQGIKSFDLQTKVTSRYFYDTELLLTKEDFQAGKKLDSTTVKRTKRTNPRIEEKEFRQVFERGKGRIEFQSVGIGKHPYLVVDDGETQKVHAAKASKLEVGRSKGTIVGEGEDYLETYWSCFGRLSIVKCFRARDNLVLRPAAPDMGLGALEAGFVPRNRGLDLAGWGFRVALDPKHGFLPATIERIEKVDEKPFVVRKTAVKDWKNIGGGLWVPIHATTYFYSPYSNKDNAEDADCEVELVVDVTKSSWNSHIQESAFQVPVPAGTRVTDLNREAQYITGKPDPGKNLDDLAAHARDYVPVAAASPQPAYNGLWFWLVASLVVVTAVLIGAYWLYRKHQQKRSK